MRKLLIGIMALVVMISATANLPGTSAQADSNTPWVNDSSYGHASGGFYLDPLSCQIWTPDSGWHYRSATGEPLWVNHPYGPAGGFYWDPISCQIWTGDAGWHTFNPLGVWTTPPQDPCVKQLGQGETALVQAGCIVTGDIEVSFSENGPWESLKFDDHPKTGTILIVTNALWVHTPHGEASVQSIDHFVDSIHAMRENGCEGGCDWVNVTTR